VVKSNTRFYATLLQRPIHGCIYLVVRRYVEVCLYRTNIHRSECFRCVKTILITDKLRSGVNEMPLINSMVHCTWFSNTSWVIKNYIQVRP